MRTMRIVRLFKKNKASARQEDRLGSSPPAPQKKKKGYGIEGSLLCGGFSARTLSIPLLKISLHLKTWLLFYSPNSHLSPDSYYISKFPEKTKARG